MATTRSKIIAASLLAASPDRDDERGILEHPDVLRNDLAGHVQALAEPPERLPVPRVEAVEAQV
jgi:hypothetical protein